MSTIDQRELRRSGYAEIEPDTVATFLNICTELVHRKGDITIFDIGSNSGMYSLAAKSLFSSSVAVHAFEPAEEASNWISRISEVNNYGIIVHKLALSDTKGNANFYISQKSDASNSLEESFREHKDVVIVEVNTLDALTDEFGIYPDLIKVDAETFDYQVLSGSRNYLSRNRPYIICEVLNTDTCDYGEKVTQLMDGLAGYTYYFINSSGILEKKSVISGDPAAHYRDWLFAPEPISDSLLTANLDWRMSVAQCTRNMNVTGLPKASKLKKKKSGFLRRLAGKFKRIVG
jgi:FkbM family methyltransferase